MSDTGLDQFITQSALAARNLAEGQSGILFGGSFTPFPGGTGVLM